MSRKRKGDEPFAKEIAGWAILFKNDNAIRNSKFNSRWERKQMLADYNSLCKIGTGDSYYIIIKLDDL